MPALPLVLAVLLAAPPPATPATPPAEPRLLWPLAAYDGLAASFGELRGDRLHTGLDLRTRGETGWPVRAAAAGRIVRLNEEYRGYGLALYLEHADGLVTVYAHLDRVAPDLEERLAAARRGRGSRWAGDVTVTPARAAARGEVVAWSGESGAGLPHLHFETRRGMDRPVDPFAAGLEPPRDEQPPVAEELVLEPAAAEARVNGSPEPHVLPLVRDGRGYRARERPRVAGPVRLALRAHDRCGADNWIGLAGLRTRVDGAEIYRVAFAAIPFAVNHSAGAVLDLGRSHGSPAWYSYRLTGLEGAELPFAGGLTGPLVLAPGRHTLEVDLEEPGSGGGTRLAIELQAVAPASEPAPGPPLEAARVQSLALGLLGDHLYLGAVVAGAAPGDGVAATLGGATLVLAHRDGDLWDAVVPAPAPSTPFAAQAGAVTLRAATTRLDSTAGFTLVLGDFALSGPAGAAWASRRVLASEVAAVAPAGLTPLGPAVRLLPDGHPFRARSEVRFGSGPAPPRAGVYRLDPATGSWAIEDLGRTAQVRRLGTYALLADEAPPRIERLVPSPGSELRVGPVRIEALVTDLGAGIPEEGVRIELDGRPLATRFDPDRDLAWAEAEMAAGSHQLRVTASDRAGNRAVRAARVQAGE